MSKQPAAALSFRSVSDRAVVVFLLMAGLAMYANTLGNGFVMDDIPVFLKHSYVQKGMAGIPELLRTPYWHGYTTNPNALYRPLSLILIAIEHDLFGPSPLAAHLINMLLYAACVALLYQFLLRLFGREQRLFAALAALLFAVHPVHTEVGAYAKSCDELLSFMFQMLALNALLRYWDGGRRSSLLGGGLFFLLALLSKESAIFLAGIVPLLAYRYRRSARGRALAGIGVALAAAGVYLAVRAAVLHVYEPGPFEVSVADNSLAAADGFGARLANAFMLLGHYLRLLVFPQPLMYDYSYTTLPLLSWSDASVWLSMAIYLGLAGLALYRTLRRRGDRLSFGILYYLAGIALFANLVLLLGSTFAERFLFSPSAGFCIAVAALVTPAGAAAAEGRRQRTGRWVLGAAMLAFAGMTLVRNTDWKDEETLYATDLEKAPLNYRVPYNLATIHSIAASKNPSPELARAELESAIPYLQQSIRNFDRYAAAWSQQGAIYMQLGRLDSGLLFCRTALEINPMDTFTRNNIAAYYFKTGDYREAIRLSRVNLEQYPDLRQSYANIGACFLKLGRPDSAIAPLQQAWKLEPGNPRTGYFLNVAFSMNAQPDSAARYAAFAAPGR